MGMPSPLLNWRSDLSVRNGVLLYKHLIRPKRLEVRCQHPCPEATGVTICVFVMLHVPPGTYVTGRCTRI